MRKIRKSSLTFFCTTQEDIVPVKVKISSVDKYREIHLFKPKIVDIKMLYVLVFVAPPEDDAHLEHYLTPDQNIQKARYSNPIRRI